MSRFTGCLRQFIGTKNGSIWESKTQSSTDPESLDVKIVCKIAHQKPGVSLFEEGTRT